MTPEPAAASLQSGHASCARSPIPGDPASAGRRSVAARWHSPANVVHPRAEDVHHKHGRAAQDTKAYRDVTKELGLEPKPLFTATGGNTGIQNTPFRQNLTPSIHYPDWRQLAPRDISGVQICSRMRLAFRLLRVAVAAATLHLTMASPARACDQMERAAAPMSHAGHHMPAPKAPSQKDGRHPCCPTMPTGCTSATCTVLAVETLTLSSPRVTMAGSAPHTAYAADWQSVSSAPEPPPPRA